MKCWTCDHEAIGVCRFCGRGVCENHHKTTTYIITAYEDSDRNLNCLAVDGVLFCGKCKPYPKPIKITEADITRAASQK
ncbi:MAG: hypothetical protein ACM3SY_13500 [Candidatus Omnitrophota bacterium]